MIDVQDAEARSGTGHVLLVALIVAVTVLNGSMFFLKRTGVVDQAEYARYFEKHLADGPHARGLLPTPQYLKEQPYRAHLFRLDGATFVLKRLKDAFVVSLLLLSALCLVRRRAIPSLRNAWPGYVLAGMAAALFLLASVRHGLLFPLFGVRAFSFLLLALFLAGCRPLRERLSSALEVAATVLLVLEIPIVIVEAARGMPIWGYLTTSPPITFRLVGTFDLPNTLGVFVVVAFAFRMSSVPGEKLRWVVLLLTLVLVVLSGSGTGAVVLAALGVGAIVERFGRRAFIPMMLMVVLSIPLLPAITGRPELFDSPTARVREISHVYEGMGGIQLVVGRAFGAGTNAAFQVSRGESPWGWAEGDKVFASSADSLPTMLLLSTGLSGLFAFYFLLLWAAVKHPRFWPFWVAICLTSLTVKLVELYPVSLFLASALAGVFAMGEESREKGRDELEVDSEVRLVSQR